MPRKDATRQEHQTLVQKVLEHIRDGLDSDISLNELAAVVCVSPYHLHRIFRALTGAKPGEHVRSIRLIRAAIALRTSAGRIIDIALAAGYENHESFSRAFRAQFGRSPSEYRRLGAPPRRPSNLESFMKTFKVSVQMVKIPVSDFSRATQYYREVLGLQEEFAVEQYAWAQYNTANIPLCLFVPGQGGGEGAPGRDTGIHLSVADLKAVHKSLKRRGALIEGQIVSADDGGCFFVLKDPDGNSIKICQAV